MRYIPQATSYAWGDFWSGVVDQIGHRVRTTPLLHLECGTGLELLSRCRLYSNTLLDEEGRLLLKQLETNSACLQYTIEDLGFLVPHGLRGLSMEELIQSVRDDLAIPQSRIRSSVSQDWHSRLATVLQLPFSKSWPERQTDLKSLKLIPLRGQNFWVSSAAELVYFLKVDEDIHGLNHKVDIPDGLGFKVADPVASRNQPRRKLFSLLGVRTATVDEVRSAIFSKYRGKTGAMTPEHLRFVYTTHAAASTTSNYDQIRLLCDTGDVTTASESDLYINDEDDPYGASILLRTSSVRFEGRASAQFLHSSYFVNVPSTPPSLTKSWKDWLHDLLNVRRHIRLTNKDQTKLSDVAEYVRQHQPTEFMGLLQRVWEAEVNRLPQVARAQFIEHVRQVRVQCADGTWRELASVYLPTKQSVKLSQRFLLDSEIFPWLQVNVKLDGEFFPSEWEACSRALGLRRDASDATSIEFLLSVLEKILEANRFRVQHPKRVYKLYVCLQTEIWQSSNTEKCSQLMR